MVAECEYPAEGQASWLMDLSPAIHHYPSVFPTSNILLDTVPLAAWFEHANQVEFPQVATEVGLKEAGT